MQYGNISAASMDLSLDCRSGGEVDARRLALSSGGKLEECTMNESEATRLLCIYRK